MTNPPISLRAFVLISTMSLLAGCANWQTVFRNEESAGKTIALDATQRVVVSTQGMTPAGKDGKPGVMMTRYCPEPSPDAIAAFAASLGLAASGPAKGSTIDANLQTAVASQVASIGLRTPTTQVIRDLITAACIAHMNGAFEDQHFTEAFERNQDFVLAAHAIAVIGGEPVARQFMLNSSAGAGSSDAREALIDYEKAQDARIKAESDLAEKSAKKTTAKTDSDAADKALKDAQAKVPKDDAAIKTAQTDADQKKTVLTNATKDETAATKTLADAKDREKRAQGASDAANAGHVSAGGSGSAASPASLARASATVNLSDKGIVAIAEIVSATLLSGFSLERCINHLIDVSKSTIDAASKAALTTTLSELCQANYKAAAKEAEVRRTKAQNLLDQLR